MRKFLLMLSSLIIPVTSVSLMTSCFRADRVKPPAAQKYLDSYIIKTIGLDKIKSVQLEEVDDEVTINFDNLIISADALGKIKTLALTNEQSPEFRFLKEQEIVKEAGDFDIYKTTLNFSKTVRVVDPVFTDNNIKFTHIILELHVFKEEKDILALKNTYKIELTNDFTIANLNDFKTKAASLTLTDFNIDPNIIKDINHAKEKAFLSNNNDLFKLAQFFGKPISLEKKVVNNVLLITIKVDNYLLVKDLSLKI